MATLEDSIKVKKDESINKLDDKIDYLVNPEHFLMPTMGDYYLGAVDGVYLKKIDELANTKLTGDGKDAAFYTDTPPMSTMGEEDGMYYLKATVSYSDEDIDQGFIDGRTLNINIDNVSGDSEEANKVVSQLKEKLVATMQGYGSIEDNVAGNTYFTLRLVGIGCPATPKWAFEYDYPNSTLNKQVKKIEDIKNNSSYIFVNNLHDDSEELNFVKIAGAWREATFYSQGDETSSFRWLMDSGDEAREQAFKAAKNLKALIEKNGNEIYFFMDKSAISVGSSMSSASLGKSASDASIMGELSYSVQRAPSGSIFKTGYNRAHQEAFRRFSGAVYIKADGKMCNIAKMALTDKTNEELYADDSYDGNNKDRYKLASYDQKKSAYADAYFEVLSQLDDRKKLQKEIFNQDFSELNKWTVTIGDVTLFIPPTNIQCTSSVQNDYQPMLRAKGSASKGGHRVTRTITLEVYFNEERGINGYTKEITLPNKTALTYKMNGLRQLIAQFKFTPFLPIENDYINDTLGIDAVIFEGMKINNVLGYPKLYQVTIAMSEFDYGAYMPELYNYIAEHNYDGNVFAASINWPVMRYYYQRCIRKGDVLAASGYKFNSDDYNYLMVGNRTTLKPMAFKSNDIDFYLANQSYLDQMMKARMELLNGSAKTVIDFSKEEIATMKKLGVLSKAIKEAVGSEEFRAALKSANQNSTGYIGLRYSDSDRSIDDNQRPDKDYNDFYGTGVKYHNTNNLAIDEDKNFDWEIGVPITILRNYIRAVNETLGDAGYLISDTRLAFETQSKGKKLTAYLGLSVECSTDYLSNDTYYDDLKRDASSYIGVDKDGYFKDHKLFISLKCEFYQKSGYYFSDSDNTKYGIATAGFEMDMNSTDMKFLEFCENAEELEKEANDIKKRRSLTNLNELDSLKYDYYDVGKAYVQSFGASLSNHVSAVHINNISGTSAQYLGGEDTMFEFELKMTSREAAAKLCALPKIAAKYARDYHMLLPYYPIRVDSEITAFLGCNEVVIETANIVTSNEETGVYTVQLLLRSVDRTMRNREAMERAELHNSGYNRDGARVQNKVKTFFEIKDILSNVELYPDLELPTISELNKVGYEYIRYKFQDGRKYVDPDFYFVYPQVLTSQIIREMAINGCENGLADISLTDKTGASVDIEPAEHDGFKCINTNDLFGVQQNAIEQAERSAAAIKAQKEKEREEEREAAEKSNKDMLDGNYEQWAISQDITPMFLEKKYRRSYKTHEAYEKLAAAAKKDEKENKDDDSTNEKDADNAEAKSDEKDTTSSVEEANSTTEDAKTTLKIKDNGEWVANKLNTAAETSTKIIKYLTDTPIAEMSDGTQANDNEEAIYDTTHVDTAIGTFLEDSTVQEILEGINIKYSDSTFVAVMKNIVYAAGCAATGEKEYAGKNGQKNWRMDTGYIASVKNSEGQETNGLDKAKTKEDGIENGIRFGCFGFEMYTGKELMLLTGDTVEAKDGDGVNGTMYLLDPYYRSDKDRIVTYKTNCINSVKFATTAFLRNMLYWLSKLIDDKIIPSITNDVLRKSVTNELSIQNKQAAAGAKDTSDVATTLTSNIDFFNKRTYAIDSGKMFVAALMALTNGDKILRDHMKSSNYRELNAYVQSCSNPSTVLRQQEKSALMTRKLVLALVGLGRIKEMSAIGSSPATPASHTYQKLLERKYIEASEDPTKFVPHSFHDMVVNDARGRMLRAFPTFYMVFIDEGREIGQWKLHDNFYTTNALLSLEIVKSRKLAADTAIISMSNFYQSYTTEADDFTRQRTTVKVDNESSWDDAIDSIFSPNEYAKREETKRTAMPPQVRMRLREGARLHIRLGYGSSANMLPIVFNGCITEVSAEDTVEITAQGDGIELVNPIIEDVEEAHELNNDAVSDVGGWDIFRNNATTKQIMTWLLTRKGGWMQELAHDTKYEGVINCNPYGIYHFGSPDLQTIHKSGEICQNIFDSWDSPLWGDYEEKDGDTPQINIQMFQKSVWDVANICKSIMPDFICAVAPFSFRSTLFIGDPRYYYAYDYDNSTGSMIEKRKPYQQYHIYTAYSDIIADGISASSAKMKTNAIGLFSVDCGTGSMQGKTSPVMADIDIYPEFQKTMVVDTRLFAKSIPMLSGVIAPLAYSWDKYIGSVDTKGATVDNIKIAKAMALSALLDSMRDMYCGDIIVLGDSTVKPHDRIYINDIYEGFKGQATVKEVVHSFNVSDGFTTAISPDCIVKADPKFELGAQALMNTIASGVTAILGMGLYNAAAKMFKHVPSISSAYNAFKESELGDKIKAKLTDVKESIDEALEKAAEKSSTIKKGEEAAKKTAKIVKKAKNAATALKAGLAASGYGIPILIAETMVSYAITQSVSNMIADKLRSMNAVKVFPLERYCIPYTAGLTGSKGLVISEHAPKNMAGGIKAALADLIPEDNAVFNIFCGLLLTDEATAMIQKFKRDNGIIDSEGNPTTTNAVYAQRYLSSLGVNAGTNDYNAMKITPRVDLSKVYKYSKASELTADEKSEYEKLCADTSDAYNRYAITDSDKWFINPKLRNNINVSSDPKLQEYIDLGYFYVIHERPELNKQEGKVITQVLTTSSGEEDYVKAIVTTENGATVYDVPMLNQDAINIIGEVVRRSRQYLSGNASADSYEVYEKTKGSYVLLKSGLRVGDTTSQSSTGFSFVLQGTSTEVYDAIIKAAEELTLEVEEDYKKSDGLTNETLFIYLYGEDNGINNNEVLFTVFPPKISTRNTGDNTAGE